MSAKILNRASASLAIAATLVLVGCEQAPSARDHAAELKPAVDAFINGWNTGNLDQLDAYVAENVERRAPGFAISAVGLSGLKDVMRGLRTAYPDLNIVVDESWYQDDLAFIRWTASGTNTGPGEIAPTGKAMQVSGLTALHYENGKMVLEDVYLDQLGWVQQLGFKLTPPKTAADKADKLADALSATWSGMGAGATVVDWEGNVLREGTNAYTCLPSPPMLSGSSPMCMDGEWMKWADAWQHRKAYAPKSLGISYMLAGDEGASNVDPYAEGPTADNEWIEEGAHLMILAPKPLLDSFPTDPDNGGPYVMWKGTPYAHLMVPIGERPD